MNKIENVFIDTSVFIKENYLDGVRLQSLLKLFQEGHFQLVLPLIIVKEIKGNFRKDVKAAIAKHSEVINDKEGRLRVLKNEAKAKSILVKFPDYKAVSDTFDRRLDRELRKAKAVIVGYANLNIGNVFEDYFNNRHPFNSADKKSEFPDAFAIATLEMWCIKYKSNCTVFSLDKDFLKTSSKHLTVRSDYDVFLADYLASLAYKRIQLLHSLFEVNSASIDGQVGAWVADQLDNITIYYEFVNGMEIHDITSSEVEVLDKEMQIIGIDGDSIEVEINVTVGFKVDLVIDDEESWFRDSDDKSVHYRDQSHITLENSGYILPIRATFLISDEDDFDEDCEIVEFNRGQALDVEFDRDRRHY